ncbi:hypothetical protein ACHAPI_010595 [Fusarium lateritium]
MDPPDVGQVGGHASQASETVCVDSTSPKDGRTFRITSAQLAGPVVRSLATEIHGRSQSATVTFQNVSHHLQAVHASQTRSVLLPKSSGNQPSHPQYLVLDHDFFGMTTLYVPPLDDHKVDVIAISGLSGHAFGSFKVRGGDYMWLRDSLPYDISDEDTDDPMARVTIYGYESGVANSNSFQNLEDLAASFYSSLRVMVEIPTRPIILIAHSLGGLIVKQALISLSKSRHEDDIRLIRAVIQQREFHAALGEEGDSEIICFYETEESPTARRDKNGQWSMSGPRAQLVTKSSATHCRMREMDPEQTCAIARPHSDLVKFGPHDHEYHKVREIIIGLARRALVAQHRKQSADAKFLIPYPENPDFVNRSEIFEKLKSQLAFDQHLGTAGTRPRVSLFGLGGVGKTQVALAYVYWLRKKCPDVSVFWVYASNEERFRQSYASIAEECNIPGRDDPEANLLALVKQETKHLLHGKLGRYIPECAYGSILVTTRNKQAGSRLTRGKLLIEVGNMNSHEVSELVRNTLENNDILDEEISGLATRLENLPLALAQAASFIHENSITIDDYIMLLDKSDVALVECLSEPFEMVGQDSETPYAVTATWIISFEQIERQDRFTGEILSLISLFDRQAIPRNFITSYWQKERVSEAGEPSPETKITKALGTLKAFCFILEAKDQSLNMPRLV